MQAFEGGTQTFSVLYKEVEGGDEVRVSVPRIRLCFRAEDPFVFRDRVVAAHAVREEAEAAVRHALFIECMPTEELPPIEKERISRVLGLALNTERLKELQLHASSLIAEVNIDYARAMASIIFKQRASAYADAMGDASIAATAPPDDMIFSGFSMPAEAPKPPVPESAVLVLGGDGSEYETQRTNFGFHTFLSKTEVVHLSQRVRTECNRVLELSLFTTALSKSYSDEEFTKEQDAVVAATVVFLKDTWMAALKSAVRNGLKGVGKGCFNLAETNREVYGMSKLSRFLRMVNYMMEDCVIMMADTSLQSYVDFIGERCSYQVDVISCAEVTRVPIGEAWRTAHLPPLFQCKLVAKPDGGGVEYDTAPQAFVDAAVAAFAKASACVQDIPQLEKFVMEGLFWSDTPMLQTIATHEGITPMLKEQVSSMLHAALPAMDAYLALYEPYNATVTLDLEEHVAKYAASDKSIAEMQADVKRENAHIAAIEEEIPTSIIVGLFSIDTMAIRKALIEKHQAIGKAQLSLIATKVRERGKSVSDAFDNIQRSVSRGLADVEQVAELEEYIANLPAELAELQETLDLMVSENGVLEDCEYPMPDDEFKQFYKTLAWPRRIEEACEVARERADAKRDEYAAAQRAEQDAYDKSLVKLEKIVSEFGKYTDLAKVDDVAKVVKNLQAELKEADAKKLLFNKREAIFGLPMTDYSKLAKIVKNFEPFANLWATAANWKSWQANWLDGPFIELDPEEMEKELANAQRTMFKLVKTFDGVAGLGDISKTVKGEIEEFMPNMPLVAALRNPGMRERHWSALTESTGRDLTKATTEEFTLTELKTYGLESQIEIVTKVCDTAGKEFAIEQAMDKMEGEWKGVNLDVQEYRETKTFVLKGFDVIQALLDDHIVMTQSMSFSPFKGPFAQRIDDWEKMLTLMSEIFEEWIKCQRAWMYLEPIFSSDDIMRQLPTEGKRFQGVDRTWRKLLGQAHSDPDAITYCKTPRLLPSFAESNQLLELVQKGLTDYLETKRAAFARFYFLSNDECVPTAPSISLSSPPLWALNVHPVPRLLATCVAHLASSIALAAQAARDPLAIQGPPRGAAAPLKVLRERQQARVPKGPQDDRHVLGRGRAGALQDGALSRGLGRVLDERHPVRDEGHRPRADRPLGGRLPRLPARRVGAPLARAGHHRWLDPLLDRGGRAGDQRPG